MPEGDPVRAWLHRLRSVAQNSPLPGRLRVNVGVTPAAATALQHVLRREAVPVAAIDCAGRSTYRIEIDGVTFEWLAARAKRAT
jgi:hypothetical protein